MKLKPNTVLKIVVASISTITYSVSFVLLVVYYTKFEHLSNITLPFILLSIAAIVIIYSFVICNKNNK